jgi:hypothetical protein
MFKRIRRLAGFSAMGMCFQLVGCESNDVWEVVAAGMKDVAAEITGIFFNAAVDEVFELN